MRHLCQVGIKMDTKKKKYMVHPLHYWFVDFCCIIFFIVAYAFMSICYKDDSLLLVVQIILIALTVFGTCIVCIKLEFFYIKNDVLIIRNIFKKIHELNKGDIIKIEHTMLSTLGDGTTTVFGTCPRKYMVFLLSNNINLDKINLRTRNTKKEPAKIVVNITNEDVITEFTNNEFDLLI